VDIRPIIQEDQQGDIDWSILLLDFGFLDVFIDGTKFASVTGNCTDEVFFGEQENLMDLHSVFTGSTVKAVTYVRGWKLEREDLQLEVGMRPELRNEILDVRRRLFTWPYSL
jgi:hypothetical protein